MAGAIWGVVARVWMRVISAEHEFTWGGTLGIIGIFAVFGLGQAVAAIARRSAWPMGRQIAMRVLSIVATIPMGLAAGAPMLPYLLLAALALGRTDLHRAVRFALAALAIVPTLFVLRQLVDDIDLWRAVLGWMLMFAIYARVVWGWSLWWGRVGRAGVVGWGVCGGRWGGGVGGGVVGWGRRFLGGGGGGAGAGPWMVGRQITGDPGLDHG